MRHNLLLLIYILIYTTGFSQQSLDYQKYRQKRQFTEGYVITLDSLVVEGLVRLPGLRQADPYKQVVFVSPNGKKNTFLPNAIKGYGFGGKCFISDESAFYKLIKIGERVSLYERVAYNSWNGPVASGNPALDHIDDSDSFFVKRNHESEFIYVWSKKKFRILFAEFFSDCPKVSKKIQEKELTHRDIRKIINIYNKCDLH